MGYVITYLVIGFAITFVVFSQIQRNERVFINKIGDKRISDHLFKHKSIYFTVMVFISPILLFCYIIKNIIGGKFIK